jgi:hypothetical protein
VKNRPYQENGGHQVQDRNNPYTGSNDAIAEIFRELV